MENVGRHSPTFMPMSALSAAAAVEVGGSFGMMDRCRPTVSAIDCEPSRTRSKVWQVKRQIRFLHIADPTL